jgi:hypothetical protein
MKAKSNLVIITEMLISYLITNIIKEYFSKNNQKLQTDFQNDHICFLWRDFLYIYLSCNILNSISNITGMSVMRIISYWSPKKEWATPQEKEFYRTDIPVIRWAVKTQGIFRQWNADIAVCAFQLLFPFCTACSECPFPHNPISCKSYKPPSILKSMIQ